MAKKSKKVYSQFYYIVDLADIHNLRLMHNHYASWDDAYEAIAQGLRGNYRRYYPINGGKARRLRLHFYTWNYQKVTKVKRTVIIPRYEYPKERITKQNRKTYRTIMRRRARGE